jgi:hypothetical protein
MTATDAAGAIGDELRRGDTDFALRLLARTVGDFRRLTDTSDIADFLAPPASTGDGRWDTLLAVAIGRECRRRGLEAPAWTKRPPLDSWWFPVPDPVLMARTFQRTPVDLAVHGIWLDGSALESV